MIVVIPRRKSDAALGALRRAGEKPWVIGEVIRQRRGRSRVEYS
jgi:phosphoribosylaminoimidazole (AIR) synthetase